MNRHWWYSVTLFIASGIFSGVTIANAVYFSRAKTNCSSINRGQANTMFWLNVILAVVMILIFLWSIFNIIYTEEGKAYVKGVAATSTTTTTTKTVPLAPAAVSQTTYYPTSPFGTPMVPVAPAQPVGGVVYPVATPVPPPATPLVATSSTNFADAVTRSGVVIPSNLYQPAPTVVSGLPSAFTAAN